MSKKYTTETIINKFKKIHGEKYIYNNVVYGKNQLDKVLITCPLHGNFLQTPKDHLTGKGCSKCGYNKISKDLNKGIEYWISLANKVHNNRYDYEEVVRNYTTVHCKYNILCKQHGYFEQDFSAHIHQKTGCPQCWQEKQHGFNLSKWINNSQGHICTLYIINIFNQDESFIKVGITYDTVEKRFIKLKQSGYEYKIMTSVSVPEKGGRAIALIELEVHLALQDYKYKPQNSFKGQGECYKLEYLNNILQRIQYEIDLMRYNLMMFENLLDNCYDFDGEYNKYIDTRSKPYGLDQQY